MVFFGIGNLGFGQITISSTTPVVENFAIGTSATASLPSNWKMSPAGDSAPTWLTGGNFTATTQAASTGAPNSGGRYNWGNGTTTTDRAIGFMASGSYANPNSVMAFYSNTSGLQINDLAISFDYERYRINSAVCSITFFTSTDGTTWTARTAGDSGAFSTATNAYNFTTGTVVSKSFTLSGLNIPNNGSIYLRWNFNTTGSNSQGIGLDNVSLTPTFAITWNGSVWSNTVGPDATTDAVITGTYSTSVNGTFTAKKLTISTGGSLTVNSGTNITLTEGLVNSLTAAAVVVENNANIVQTTGTTNVNTGAITVKRNSNPLMLLDYGMWGSPVSGQQLQAFSPATLSNRFYSYNTTTNIYTAETATNNFADGKGYLIRMPNDHPTTPTIWTGSFVGVPHSGDYTFTPAVGFNSVANPYPSTISMATFVADNPTITGTLYFWRKTNSTTILPGYCSWNNGTYVSNGQPGAISDVVGNDMLQVGQGFIVNATATTGVLFKNTQRTANNDNQNYKASANATASAEEKNRVWLNLTSANGSFSQTAFGYMTNATNGVDSYDGESFNDGNVAISSLIADQKFVIQGKALPFVNTDLVPLYFKVNQAGNYTIAIDNVDGLFANNGQAVYLRDALLNTEVNLSAAAYSFASAQGEFNNRFVVAFTPQTLGNSEFSVNTVVVYKNNNTVIVNSGNVAMESVKVFDLTGRLLLDKKNINNTTTALSVDAKNQVILVQVKDINGNTVSKKVIN